VPARIRGTYKVLNRVRGFSGLHPVSLNFGPPVDLSAEWAQKGGREVYAAITDKIMAAIAAIPPLDGRDDDAGPGPVLPDEKTGRTEQTTTVA
jgi:hypothetical protein